MPLVLDASVCGSWMLPGESHPLGARVLSDLFEDQAVVPAIWWYEVRNLLLTNERRGRGTPENTAFSLANLQRLHVVTDTGHESDELMRLARAHRLTVYDAAYLELALRRGLQLATLDRRLAAAARAEKIPVMEEDD